jgi:hypothetical protein
MFIVSRPAWRASSNAPVPVTLIAWPAAVPVTLIAIS